MSPSTGSVASADILLVGDTDWLDAFAAELARRCHGTVLEASSIEDALELHRTRSLDCIVTEYELDGATGIQLLESVRDRTATIPVVLATASGDEAVASEAIGAGVTDYVSIDRAADTEAAFEPLFERLDRALRSARRTVTRRHRARQFDASFHDARTATWVLDRDGALTRANQAARDMIDVDIDTVVGEPFWTLPWWAGPDGLSGDIRSVTEQALGGSFANAVVMLGAASDDAHVLDVSARPVTDERGDVVSVVVDGVDITERVGLERDLRQSEALHRVTLNNMTDTVLITNEAGEYTYVCPNVHFIFGYTAREIHELGTIDALLGEDLFDREQLAAEGVLKNIECPAEDKAGREHTLLVNVREVSIQDGTLLYSCRDVTKRKQREEALATLQETARDFLYAETAHEIADHVVEDTPGVLDLEASGVYLFDGDENQLRPVARSPRLEELHGPLSTVHADASSLVGYSFIEDESLFLDDVHESDRLENPATDVRSAAYIPLGDHGVFFVGSVDVGRFDAVTRELADLLAATAEAALDRVARESQLREQDRELQRQNRQLTTLNRVNEIIREIDQALVQAETRAEIEHSVCERLTEADRFRFAWIGVVESGTGTIEPSAWAGVEQGYLDSTAFPMTTGDAEPTARAAASRMATMVSDVPAELRAEPWRKEALTRDYLSALSVPLVYDGHLHGVLSVYATSRLAFDEMAQAVLAELGETIAAATSAIERKHALLTTAVTRFEYAVDDPSFVLSRVAREAGCRLKYHGGVQQTDDGSYVFVTVEGADLDRVETAAADLVAVDDVQRIGEERTGGVLRLHLTQPFLALELAGHGAVLRRATADETSTVLVIDVPESVDGRLVQEIVSSSFSETELRSKQTFDRSSTADPYGSFLDELTDRQLEVLQTAYFSGYFESPRERTGEEVAETLGISPAAFYQHARTVQRKLFATVFDDPRLPRSQASG
ncbi:MAG: bacterio-opsin activator domain-containing protein [Halobacteriales archaeon]|nr:bacterio-opsin activator domain-containing protein [Halobacteriales archaeon]